MARGLDANCTCGNPLDVRPAVLTLARPRRKRLVQVAGCRVCGRMFLQPFDPYRRAEAPAQPATTTNPEAPRHA